MNVSASARDDRTRPEVLSIAIARDPALVRTVRLVSAAVARRSGQDEGVVEEVRLAVGEACAVMIGAEEPEEKAPGGVGDGTQVRVGIRADREGFAASITGQVGDADPSLDEFQLDPWVLLRGIDEGLTVDRDGDLTTVTVRWPAS